jgi:CubicO group peptidase (beta-lactamase class C family)
MTVDTTMWIASCTKLMTTIAVLQCVEKGLLDLDEHVGRFLPELADPDLLYGFDEETGELLLTKAKNKITMRNLLTHSSGIGYELFTPALLRWHDKCRPDP